MQRSIQKTSSNWHVRLLYRCLGIGVALIVWQVVTSRLVMSSAFAASFSPANTFRELAKFIASGDLVRQSIPSLTRFGIGLLIALLAGFQSAYSLDIPHA